MRKTRKQNGGNMAEAQRRIDKWITDGNVNNSLKLSLLNLTSLPRLPNSLKRLDCYGNKLISLPTLPNSLERLDCFSNKLISLPTLPNSLKRLDCFNNKLISLPTLPESLEMLFCNQNKLTSLPKLPNSLLNLICDHNKLRRLPNLPNSLIYLRCYNNKLTTLPNLPDGLKYLNCEDNNLPSIYYDEEYEVNDDEEENRLMEDYLNRIRKLQKSRKNVINSFKSHITEKKRNNLANMNSKYPRNIVKQIANYMDEEDLENINTSLKPKNVKNNEAIKLKKLKKTQRSIKPL